MLRYDSNLHTPVEEGGWVYHYGITVFFACFASGERIHVWCLQSDTPFDVKPNANDPIQTFAGVKVDDDERPLGNGYRYRDYPGQGEG